MLSATLVVCHVGKCYSAEPQLGTTQLLDPRCAGINRNFTLVFLHFEKCAGTTVEAALIDFARECDLGIMRYPCAGCQLKGRELQRFASGEINILMGHNFYGVHLHLPKDFEWSYVAVFRDPVDRIWSHFNHQNCGVGKCTSRKQRYCGRDCTIHSFAKKHSNYFKRRLLERKQLLPNKDPGAGKGLGQALRNLENFSLIGTSTKLDIWLSLIGWVYANAGQPGVRLHEQKPLNVRNSDVAVVTAESSAINQAKHARTYSGRIPNSSRKRVLPYLSDDMIIWELVQQNYNNSSGKT